ncbi:MAG: alkaline phosphatase family protein [Ferruginibacter sp.]|nr:alkaline phosphatase family protein [Cytophagales bacterium]
MKKFSVLLLLGFPASLFAQTKTPVAPAAVPRPKLVVGIMVDQMRYDFLYRYWDKYGTGGFKRLVREGYSCENTHYDYVPTYTGPGHAAVYTGTGPATNGIIGNEWFVRQTGKSTYVTDDSTVATVGSASQAGVMSPRNLLSSTVTDELRLSNNRQSKVIGVCLKDRGCILPAGHLANAAYWYDGATGNWITSTYYMSDLPPWLKAFNDRKLSDQYLSKPWTTLLPPDQYPESLADNQPFELLYAGETQSVFPHNLPKIKETSDYDLVRRTPFGNTLTRELAVETIRQEQMGKGKVTDFLALSFSSTDYVGHQFGPHSIESEDTYLRLDQDLAKLLTFLDGWLGKDQVLVFLTADHGVANVPAHLKEMRIPAGIFDARQAVSGVKGFLNEAYGKGDWVADYGNGQVYLNRPFIQSKNVSLAEVQRKTADYVAQLAGVAFAVTATELPGLSAQNPFYRRLQNGYHRARSGDVLLVLEPAWFDGDPASKGGTTHGSGYGYDTHVPLLWYGWTIAPGSTVAPTSIADIAPTVSGLLKIMEPNGSTGTPIALPRK